MSQTEEGGGSAGGLLLAYKEPIRLANSAMYCQSLHLTMQSDWRDLDTAYAADHSNLPTLAARPEGSGAGYQVGIPEGPAFPSAAGALQPGTRHRCGYPI